MTEDLRVNRSLTIPGDEIQITYSTSGGPGGQHANKTATRAVASWNVATSRALGERQRQRIRSHLRSRIDSSGTLRLASDRTRSQLQNRRDVLDRLTALVAESLRPIKRRVATVPTNAARERRLREKKRRADLKRSRRVLDD
ncbi:MAG: aminoacyl-tRNA hydrolase [Actinomycetota bacterium]|nr:aminoacyl-tRNA hydrolase [Actinomycetota bacterium]